MQGRYKRRSRLTKLLYVFSALFLLSLWNYYRNHPGIFYIHIGSLALAFIVFWLAFYLPSKWRKKKQRNFWGSVRHSRSRWGQSATLKRLRVELKVKGQDKEVSWRPKKSSKM